MKVLRAQGSNTRTTSEIDLFEGLAVSDDAKARVADRVGTFLVEQILQSVSEQSSPVTGEGWSGLSPKYKAFKEKEGATAVANMELTGEMLNSLTFRPTAKGVEIGFFGSEAAKADGHNHFSAASAKATAPKRRFLPDEGQNFKGAVQSEVDMIIAEELLTDIEIPKSDLKDIETKAEFFSVFKEKLPGYTRAEISSAILANRELLALLDEFDLLDYLD